MTRKVINEAGLAMRKGPRLDTITHTGHHRPFVGVREDVPINVGDLVIHSPVFVIESGNHPLVLGVPFLNRGKLCQQYGSEGVYGHITNDSNTHTVDFSTFDPKDRANREGDDLFQILRTIQSNSRENSQASKHQGEGRRNLQKYKHSRTPRQQRKYQTLPPQHQ